MGQQCSDNNTVDQNELSNLRQNSVLNRPASNLTGNKVSPLTSNANRLNQGSKVSTQYSNLQSKGVGKSVTHFSKVNVQKPGTSKITKSVQKIDSSLGRFTPSNRFNAPKGTMEQSAYTLNQQGLLYKEHGEWKNGMPHGKGQLVYPNGSYYTGYLVNGVPHGQGRFVSADGWYYEGELQNEEAQGYGRFVDERIGFEYEGRWAGDLPDGKGIEKWRGMNQKLSSFQQSNNYQNNSLSDTYYEGEFLNGFKHGQGKYVTRDFTYQGRFQDNQFNGNGRITYKNGQIYEGNFKKSMKHGHGTYRWTDGSVFEGDYQNDYKHGSGKYMAANGKTFQGQWRNGKRQGKGAVISNGKRLSYDWKNNYLSPDKYK